MNYLKLENNIIEMMKEEQLKLGYASETVRLYYPLSSLNRALGCEQDIAQMRETLRDFSEAVTDRLGKISVSNQGERFCFTIPPAGADYVHAHMGDTSFLAGFIQTIGKHGCTMEEIRNLFYQYSEHVHVERAAHGEFDWLLYFEDGCPDNFRYCITNEGCHLIYHRYTPEDYEALNL